MKEWGFQLSNTRKEGDLLIKTFTNANNKELASISRIEIVYEKYLPIYCAYFDKGGKILRKIYYSEYTTYSKFTLPSRITDISFPTPSDSIIRREIYSNVQVDNMKENTYFDFEIPASAKSVPGFKQ